MNAERLGLGSDSGPVLVACIFTGEALVSRDVCTTYILGPLDNRTAFWEVDANRT